MRRNYPVHLVAGHWEGPRHFYLIVRRTTRTCNTVRRLQSKDLPGCVSETHDLRSDINSGETVLQAGHDDIEPNPARAKERLSRLTSSIIISLLLGVRFRVLTEPSQFGPG